MKKNGSVREDADDNIIRRMRFACWISTTRLCMYMYTYFVSKATALRERGSMLRSHLHCLLLKSCRCQIQSKIFRLPDPSRRRTFPTGRSFYIPLHSDTDPGRLTSVGPQCGTQVTSPFWHLFIELSPRFFEYLYEYGTPCIPSAAT